MERPKFLEFGEAIITEWRGHPVSAAFVDWLAFEADRCNYECAALLRKGREKEAIAVAGKAEALQEILSTMHRQDEPAEPKEERFVDPVFRFNQSMAPTDVEGAQDAGTE